MRVIIFLLMAICSQVKADSLDFFSQKNKKIVISPDQVYEGSYFEIGEAIEIAGTIKGNTYIIGSHIVVSGTIEGDLLAIGGVVTITGVVKGKVKVLAGQGDIGGEIGGKSIILGVNVQMPSQGKMQGSLLLISAYGEIDSKIEGDVMAITGGLKLGGVLNKNLRAALGTFQIMSTARVLGDLKYRSNQMAFVEPGAQIGGKLIYKPSLIRSAMDKSTLSSLAVGSKIATFLMNFIYTFVVGVFFIRFFPAKLQRTLFFLKESPVRSFFYGILIIGAVPIISIFLLVTIIGTPFALALIALNIIGFYTVKVFSILWVSNRLFSKMGLKKNKIPILLVGQVLYYLVCFIPFIGWAISFFFMSIGLGSSVGAQLKKER